MLLKYSKIRVFAFHLSGVDVGKHVTGVAANLTATWSKDNGAPAALADTNPTEIGGGLYIFDLTEAERTVEREGFIWPASSNANIGVVVARGFDAESASGGASGGRGGTYRRTTDLSPVLFTFPTGGLADNAFTKTLRIDGGSPANVTGAISYLYQIGGKHWYRLAYNAADRPASGADGVVQYLFADGTDTVVVGLVVGGAAIAAKTGLIGTSLMTVAGPSLTNDDLERLRIGDDYKTANGRPIRFTFDSAITPASCTLVFTQTECTGTPDVLTLTGSASATGGVVTAIFEIDADDWTGISAGRYSWVMSVVDSNGNTLSFTSEEQRQRFVVFYN